MTAKTKFKSPAFEAIHSAAAGLYSVDAIAQETMRSFDETCISRVSDFQQWESGAKRPGGLALKLLTIVQKHGLEVLA